MKIKCADKIMRNSEGVMSLGYKGFLKLPQSDSEEKALLNFPNKVVIKVL